MKTYRTALITGASSGLGRGLALWFARRGTHVFAAARRKDALASLSAEANGGDGGGKIEAVAMDVADQKATVERIQELDKATGGLDLVIANAGVGIEKSAKRASWEDILPTLQVNVLGAAATLVAAAPAMAERKRGHLVGISSVAAFRGLPKMAAYCGSKAFLQIFLESMRLDLARTGVKVTSIHPGFVKTEMTAKNSFEMPFLLESEDACNRMGKAILRDAREFVFPLPMAAMVKTLRLTPDALYEFAVKNLR